MNLKRDLTQLIVSEAEGLLHKLIFEQDCDLLGHYDYELLDLLADDAARLHGVAIRDLDAIGEVSYAISLSSHHSDDLTPSKRDAAIYDAFFETCIRDVTDRAGTRKVSSSVAEPVAKWFAADQKQRDVGAVVHCCKRLMCQSRHGRNPVVVLRIAYERYFFTVFPPPDRNEIASNFAKLGANSRHNKPGGSREKRQQIKQIWATGKYRSRDICAEQECAALGMSFATARKALRNTPKPDIAPAGKG